MNRIKEVLAEKGIKQTWLVDTLGKSYNMVNGYVHNRQQPRLEVFTEIANILDVDIKGVNCFNQEISMADVHDIATRSYNMSQIKGKNTKPELLVRKFLFGLGYRYKIHDKKLPGKPDLVLPKYNTVIHVHGCFWHGHQGCKYFKLPKTRKDWWLQKINKTRENDTNNKNELENHGWRVLEIWECQLRGRNRIQTLTKLVEEIN